MMSGPPRSAQSVTLRGVKSVGPQNYDPLADEYAKHRSAHPDVVGELTARGGVVAASRVLEIGCGTGNYVAALGAATDCACTDVDASEGMLAQARRRGVGATLV